jgi:hypothetical protein
LRQLAFVGLVRKTANDYLAISPESSEGSYIWATSRQLVEHGFRSQVTFRFRSNRDRPMRSCSLNLILQNELDICGHKDSHALISELSEFFILRVSCTAGPGESCLAELALCLSTRREERELCRRRVGLGLDSVH